MNPQVDEHLNVAARNLAIAKQLLDLELSGSEGPAFDWVVVISFYAAVRSVNAYILDQELRTPRSHSSRARMLARDARLASIREPYADLENWSRGARYIDSPDVFDHA